MNGKIAFTDEKFHIVKYLYDPTQSTNSMQCQLKFSASVFKNTTIPNSSKNKRLQNVKIILKKKEDIMTRLPCKRTDRATVPRSLGRVPRTQRSKDSIFYKNAGKTEQALKKVSFCVWWEAKLKMN